MIRLYLCLSHQQYTRHEYSTEWNGIHNGPEREWASKREREREIERAKAQAEWESERARITNSFETLNLADLCVVHGYKCGK